jgi:hypothetical protein
MIFRAAAAAAISQWRAQVAIRRLTSMPDLTGERESPMRSGGKFSARL